MNSSDHGPVRCDTCNAVVGSAQWMDPKTWVLCGDCSSKGCEHPPGYLRYVGHGLHGNELIWCSRPGCGALATINGKELQSLPAGRPVLIRAGEDVVERFPEVPLQWTKPSSPLRPEDAAKDDQKTVFGVAPPEPPRGPDVASLKPKRVKLGAPAGGAPGVAEAAEAMESFVKDRTVSQDYLDRALGVAKGSALGPGDAVRVLQDELTHRTTEEAIIVRIEDDSARIRFNNDPHDEWTTAVTNLRRSDGVDRSLDAVQSLRSLEARLEAAKAKAEEWILASMRMVAAGPCAEEHEGPIRYLDVTRPVVGEINPRKKDRTYTRLATLIQCATCGRIGESYGNDEGNLEEHWAKEI